MTEMNFLKKIYIFYKKVLNLWEKAVLYSYKNERT